MDGCWAVRSGATLDALPNDSVAVAYVFQGEVPNGWTAFTWPMCYVFTGVPDVAFPRNFRLSGENLISRFGNATIVNLERVHCSFPVYPGHRRFLPPLASSSGNDAVKATCERVKGTRQVRTPSGGNEIKVEAANISNVQATGCSTSPVESWDATSCFFGVGTGVCSESLLRSRTRGVSLWSLCTLPHGSEHSHSCPSCDMHHGRLDYAYTS